MPNGSVEIALPAGGDFMLQANGDVVLIADTATAAESTTQRLIRLILTNPRILLPGGQPTEADDICNPGWGAGARASVGQPNTAELRAIIQAQILAGILTDPAIAAIPAPSVTVTDAPQLGPYMVLVDVHCETVTGEIVTIPSLPLGSVGT